MTASFVRALPVLACLGFAFLSGCGDSAATSNITRGPVVSAPTITKANASPPATGENVTIRVSIVSNTALNVVSSPPTIDLTDANNKSFFGGPQPLTSLDSDPNGWAYTFNISNNADLTSATYTVTIKAQDTFGNRGNTPYVAGGVTLP